MSKTIERNTKLGLVTLQRAELLTAIKKVRLSDVLDTFTPNQLNQIDFKLYTAEIDAALDRCYRHSPALAKRVGDLLDRLAQETDPAKIVQLNQQYAAACTAQKQEKAAWYHLNQLQIQFVERPKSEQLSNQFYNGVPIKTMYREMSQQYADEKRMVSLWNSNTMPLVNAIWSAILNYTLVTQSPL